MLVLAGVNARIELDPARLRPSDIPSLVGSPDRLRALGWNLKLTVTDALRDVLGPKVPATVGKS
jgi:GDP-4-dehydro-6-deoxy-D-mannose reductase